jgi:hypothetical protein
VHRPVRHGILLLLTAVAFLAAAAGAQAAAPSAVTGPVSAVGATSATVTGTVDPGGVATNWYVEYGTSTAYGSKTAAKSAGSGTSAVAVSVPLSGLAQGTTYHYRVVATSSAGTSHGSDGLFTTLAVPGVVTGSASSIGVSSATLNGSVDPNGRSTTWWFEYGTSTSYGSKTSAKSAGNATGPTSVSTPIGALKQGVRYHFRLVASSDAGTSHGADASFVTSQSPTATTGDASAIAPTSAKLNGSVDPNGLSTTWWFEYGTSTGYGTRTAPRSAGSGTTALGESLTITGLKPATTYHFRIVARNSSGTTAGSDKSFATSFAPAVVTGSAQGIGATGATLTGSVDPRGRSTTWWFEYGLTPTYGSKTSTRSAGSRPGNQNVSVPVTGLRIGTSYHYRLVAKSDAGTTYGSDLTVSTLGVTIGTAAREVTYGGRVQLSGTVPSHNSGEQVTIFAQAYGRGSPVSVATVLSGAGGAWSYLAKPRIGTQYQAGWSGALSAPTVVGVHPALSLVRLANGKLRTHVGGVVPFRGRIVQLQRRTAGRWLTVTRVRLNRLSRATFVGKLPKGRSTIRIAMSINQAGAGYLGGTSRTIVVTRR